MDVVVVVYIMENPFQHYGVFPYSPKLFSPHFAKEHLPNGKDVFLSTLLEPKRKVIQNLSERL